MQKLFCLICFGVFLLTNTHINAAIIGGLDTGNTTESNEWMTTENSGKLILIGIVVDRKGMQPVEGVTVELTEARNSANKQVFLTKQDGNFYFKLETDKEYALTALSKSGTKEDFKQISTVNKSSSDILRAVLQVSPAVASAPAIVNFELREGAKTASATYSLTFKVQFGAFKQSTSVGKSSSYTSKAGELFSIETESTASGYVRYLAGSFSDLNKAKEAEKKLREKDYNRTFIVPYYNGQRLSNLSPEDALKKYANK